MSELLFDVSGLTYAFHRRGKVLDDLSLQLHAGERLALTGSNGAGKTTLLNILVGLLKPRTGQITAFGKVRREESDFVEVRARAGLLFQDPDDQLFCPTVLEDVVFGPLNLGKSRAEAMEVGRETLHMLGMDRFEDRVTHHLSGGEKRMITLAAVLAMRPDVLLLDEPGNALDDKARERLLATLESLPQAMIIVSHEPELLRRLATRWLRMEDGKLVQQTVPAVDPLDC